CFVFFRCWIGDVIRADYKGDISLRKFGIDVLEFKHFVVGYIRFSEQYIHVAWHTACDRMNCVFDFDTFLFQLVGHFTKRMLRLGDRHAVSRYDDDFRGVLQDVRGILGRAELYRALLNAGARPRGFSAKAAKDDGNEGPVHPLAHDVGQNRARRADQCASDDQRRIPEGEADTSSRPSRIGIEHRDHDRHVGAADRNDDQYAEDERQRDDDPEIHHALGDEEAVNKKDQSCGEREIDGMPPRQRDWLAAHAPRQLEECDYRACERDGADRHTE